MSWGKSVSLIGSLEPLREESPRFGSTVLRRGDLPRALLADAASTHHRGESGYDRSQSTALLSQRFAGRGGRCRVRGCALRHLLEASDRTGNLVHAARLLLTRQ